MGERGIHEAAVAPRGTERDPLALEQHDLAFRVGFTCEQSGPETGEATADNEQVGLAHGFESGPRLRRTGVSGPERARLGFGVGAADGGGVHGEAAYAATAAPTMKLPRRGGRVDECDGLENR